jgi:hypothetical protein
MHRVGSVVLRLTAGVSLLGLCASVGTAAADASVGRELYVEHCAGCHGLDGRGNGPQAAGLIWSPADLTKLHERYGNPLRRDEVAAWIDGRKDLEAHGPREMPVWGNRFFEGELAPSRGIEASKRRAIELLVDYLQQLQGVSETRLRGRHEGALRRQRAPRVEWLLIQRRAEGS